MEHFVIQYPTYGIKDTDASFRFDRDIEKKAKSIKTVCETVGKTSGKN